jgi:hypothetical protein
MANEELVTRRAVFEQYVQYDARKKNMAVPGGMNEWDWSSADDLDRRLEAAKFKHGIIAGYTFWKPVELDYRDLSKCAIFNRIFQSLPRVLGQLAGLPQFETWKPDRRTEWFERLDELGDYPREWPLILRPTVSIELPAEWYVEDGSGRAICFFRRLSRSADYTSRAYGYRGVHPDPHSTFMRTKFAELLRK